MKTGKLIFVILVMVISLLGSGCIESPTQQIKGYVVNAHTDTVRVDIYRQSNIENEVTQIEDSVRVMTGETVKIYLPPGTYDIEAHDLDDNFLGSINFRLPPNAEDFYISVFSNKVTARYN